MRCLSNHLLLKSLGKLGNFENPGEFSEIRETGWLHENLWDSRLNREGWNLCPFPPHQPPAPFPLASRPLPSVPLLDPRNLMIRSVNPTIKNNFIDIFKHNYTWIKKPSFNSFLAYNVHLASSYPVVRNQTIVHILDWLKTVAKKGFEPSTFSLVKVLYMWKKSMKRILHKCRKKINGDQLWKIQLQGLWIQNPTNV